MRSDSPPGGFLLIEHTDHRALWSRHQPDEDTVVACSALAPCQTSLRGGAVLWTRTGSGPSLKEAAKRVMAAAKISWPPSGGSSKHSRRRTSWPSTPALMSVWLRRIGRSFGAQHM